MAAENISSDLIWEVTKRSNAYLVKRKGYGGVEFSRDPFNLTNRHNRTHAGYVNENAIGISAGTSGEGVTLSKKSQHGNKPSKSTHSNAYGSKKGNRSIYGSVVKSTAGKGYRSDLRKHAVARASAIKDSQRTKKDTPAPKPRGAKAKAAAAKSA